MEIKVIKKLGVEESIFTFEGNLGHEVVFFFEAELVDKENYDKDLFLIESGQENDTAVWVELDGNNLIYPQAFRQLIAS